MNCTPSSIIEASKCYCGLTAKEDSAVAIYLLCTWANQEGGPVTCGTPSDVIQISGAGSGDVNGIYVRNPILPNTYNSHDDAQAKIVVTAGNATIFYGLAGFERYYSTAEDFPCTWTLGLDGTLPVPTGQWLSSPPVSWAPANEPVTWQDSGGAHVGDLPTFLATANFPSVNSLVFGATGNLTSLTGLKYLPSLATVDCNTNALTSLDCTYCLALTSLNCSSNTSLTNVNLTGCASLVTVDCTASIIDTITLAGCSSLGSLNCFDNALTSLDISDCVSLVTLDCENNSITSLDASSSTLLQTIFANTNSLTSIDLTGCSALTNLDVSVNSLAAIDVSDCTALVTFSCFNNSLISLDVSNCTQLNSLSCYSNPLTTLNVTNCSVLSLLSFYLTSIATVDLSTCVGLTNVQCYSTSLTLLDVSNSPSLATLNLINNPSMTSLDVSGTIIAALDASTGMGSLSTCDATNCASLVTLDCHSNVLTSLLVGGCTSLVTLNSTDNSLTALDLSTCTSLATMTCDSNAITSLKIGPSTNYSTVLANDNLLPNTPNGVNECLIALEANCLGNAGSVDLNTPATNAAPTGAGATASANLTTAGWSVVTN